MISYPAVIFKDEPGVSVFFPDLDYIGTCGDDMNQALENAIDLLAGFAYDKKLEGKELPLASEFEAIDPEAVSEFLEISDVVRDGFVNIISVDLDSYATQHFEKLVRKTLTIPDRLNKLAMEANINFSKTLQEALIAKLFG